MPQPGTSSKAVEYSIADATHQGFVSRLVATCFSSSEPPAVAAGLSAEEMEGLLRLISPRIIAQGFSVVARQQGQLVGALLCQDFAAPVHVEGDSISPKFRAIFAMLQEMDEYYRGRHNPSRGQVLHVFMLAVDSAAAGQGIAQGLVNTALNNASGRGFKKAVTEATGEVSQHIFRKLGFLDRYSVSYQEFRFEGNKPFSSIPGHAGAILMDKSLV